MSKNLEIAQLLTKLGQLLELQGENPFKIKAYYKAAENIAALSEDIADICEGKRLCSIPGVGKAIESKIGEYLATGRIAAYDRLTEEFPESLLELVNIPSIGPKKAKMFYDQLKIKSLADLTKAAEEGKLAELKGVRDKTIKNILDGITLVQTGQQRLNLGLASQIAESFIAQLKRLPEVKRIEAAGSLRRGKETVRDIDLLIDSPDPGKVMAVFVKLPMVKSVNVHGEKKSSVLTHENVQVDLRVVDPDAFGAALLYFTGSQQFNIRLRQLAIKKGMKVNEYGVFRDEGAGRDRPLQDIANPIASETEEECFKALGLPYIPPELREEIGNDRLWSNVETQNFASLPRLIEQSDILGDLHVHSTWSDGKHTIAQMAEAAQARGYKYLAICDHSAKLKIARGVPAEDLPKKLAEIEALNKRLKGFRILMGSEVEIDSDGNLDYTEDILKRLDIVVAAIHSGFDQPREQLTRRLIRACENKNVHIIAHPTGVNHPKRGPYDVDFKAVCQAAYDTNTCLEINSFPQRLDLNSKNVYFASQNKVKFVINTDSHAASQLDFMKFGIGIARRGWLAKEQVINTLPLEKMLKEIK